MQNFGDFRLYLFDLDGLLVNTEAVHHRAYTKMCRLYGCDLNCTFHDYYKIAGQGADSIKEMLYLQFPKLRAFDWKTLYQEKKKFLLQELSSQPVELLPGVARLLQALDKRSVARSCVTHSSKEVVSLITAKQPILQTIPIWITRDDYDNPKPAPDGYRKALELCKVSADAAIGFEDTERGVEALLAAGITPVGINPIDHALVEKWRSKGISAFSSIEPFARLAL